MDTKIHKQQRMREKGKSKTPSSPESPPREGSNYIFPNNSSDNTIVVELPLGAQPFMAL